jgi:nuclear transcription factor Y, gamma
MKLDDDVKMISAEVPILFAKAAELFIQELTIHSWLQTEESRRRTLQVGARPSFHSAENDRR